MSRRQLLIIEDDEKTRSRLNDALRDEFSLSFAADRIQAMTVLRSVRPALVSLALGLPPNHDTADEGLKALEEILRLSPWTKLVVVTEIDRREDAIRALRLGAFDFLLKPLDLDEFKIVLRRALHLRELEEETETRARMIESSMSFEDMLGNTPRMQEIFGMVTRVAKSDVTVLIQGESGTGKELIARAIHAKSGRRESRFVPINCGAIPETLLESELFGHERGAYTGAHVQRKGKVEAAGGGTLFLDEIGEMSFLLQVKLLRFLQEREIERVGGRERIRVDARVIAATNRDLKAEIQAGRFREDLYYRLAVVNIKVPPLRERGEDVSLLANAFLRRSCEQHRRNMRFSAEALAAIASYSWPGNIRELENSVHRAVILAQARFIQPADLGIEASPAKPLGTLREAKDRAEREILVNALVRTCGNITKAASELKISRPTFHDLLEKHQMNARAFRV